MEISLTNEEIEEEKKDLLNKFAYFTNFADGFVPLVCKKNKE